jgi:hypothetical protein
MEKATWLAPWTGFWELGTIDGSMRRLIARTDGAVRTHATHDCAPWYGTMFAFAVFF